MTDSAIFPFWTFLAGACCEESEFSSMVETKSKQSGIGVTFAVSLFRRNGESSLGAAGTWYIASVPENSAGHQAGLNAGDAILQVSLLFLLLSFKLITLCAL
jgi:hypothetical protein